MRRPVHQVHRSVSLSWIRRLGGRYFVGPLVERLEFAETSCGQAVGLDSLADQILHDRDGPGC